MPCTSQGLESTIPWNNMPNLGNRWSILYHVIVQGKIDTYEECRGCEHSYLIQVIDIFHSPYQGQVEEEIHSDHLSAKNK